MTNVIPVARARHSLVKISSPFYDFREYLKRPGCWERQVGKGNGKPDPLYAALYTKLRAKIILDSTLRPVRIIAGRRLASFLPRVLSYVKERKDND